MSNVCQKKNHPVQKCAMKSLRRNKGSKVDVSENFNYCFLSESYIKTESDSKSQIKGKANLDKHV